MKKNYIKFINKNLKGGANLSGPTIIDYFENPKIN